MAQVYSELLATAHAGATVDLVAPADSKYVLRWATAFNANAIADQSAQLVHLASSCTIWQVTMGPQADALQEMRFVMNPGDTVRLIGGADVDITLSGYRLSLP